MSTPPTRTGPLCSAPPNERPDKTFVESHLLGLAIDVPRSVPAVDDNDDDDDDAVSPKRKVLVLALEVFVFTTAFATTLFVSKADSTGYLHLLGLPRGAPSPIRAATTEFLAHLVEHRGRAGVQCVVSLFARAQDQYLFAGSVENAGKHVLDDRGLVRWWCRVLDPLVERGGGARRRRRTRMSRRGRSRKKLMGTRRAKTAKGTQESEKGEEDGEEEEEDEEEEEEEEEEEKGPEEAEEGDRGEEEQGSSSGVGDWAAVKAYLVVPGLDHYETRAFVPRNHDHDHDDQGHGRQGQGHWVLGHPLELISHYCREYDWVPARCLIPRFPDDPKSRFRDELDEEAWKTKLVQTTGQWKSVRTVDQFWEMMAFRQECSSGRLTGFIWVVFDPVVEAVGPAGGDEGETTNLPTPQASFDGTAGPAVPTPTTPQKQRSVATTPMSTPRRLFPSPCIKSTSAEKKKKPENQDEDKDEDKDGEEQEQGENEEGEAAEKAKTKKQNKKKAHKTLAGPIRPRQPNVKTRQRNHLPDRPTSTPYYHWPEEGRGARVVDESDYRRNVELLLRLDFANLGLAVGSTARWTGEVGMGEQWGRRVTGAMEHAAAAARHANGGGGGGGDANGKESLPGAAGTVNNLSGLVKRKRSDTVNVLEVRKRIKGDEGEGSSRSVVGVPDGRLVGNGGKEDGSSYTRA